MRQSLKVTILILDGVTSINMQLTGVILECVAKHDKCLAAAYNRLFEIYQCSKYHLKPKSSFEMKKNVNR